MILTLIGSLAHGGTCGTLMEAEDLEGMVRQLHHLHFFITVEGDYERGPPFTIRIAEGASALAVAESAVAACGPCAGRYSVTQVGERVEVKLLDPDPDSYSLLDATVQLAPGERELTDVASEITAQLSPSEERPHRVVSNARRKARVLVADLQGPDTVRNHLAAMAVIPAQPPREGVSGPDERVSWYEGRSATGPKRNLLLDIVDLYVPPPPDDDPLVWLGYASQSEAYEARLADPRADPTPGMIEDAAYHERMLSNMEQKIEAARDFERRAAEPCDP